MDKLKYIKLENEDGSYSSSIPLAVDSDYVNVNGESLTSELGKKASTINVNSSVNNLQSQINGLASGSPAGVYATVTALTSADPDHSKIYIISEDGHWYYYNSGWQDGGVYQAAEDSDAVLDLEDDLDYMRNKTIVVSKNILNPSYKQDWGRQWNTGEKVIGDYVTFEFIPIENNRDFYFSRGNGTTQSCTICCFDENKNFILIPGVSNSQPFKITNTNVKYITISISLATYNMWKNTLMLEYDSLSTSYQPYFDDYKIIKIYENVLPTYEKLKNKNICAIAHQGFSNTSQYYGNSRLSSILNASKYGFDYCEIDIVFTSDNIPVCCHDTTFEDLTTHQIINIENSTYEELLTHNYYGETIASLEQVLEACKMNNMGLVLDHVTESTSRNVEVLLPILTSLVQKYNMQNNVYWTTGTLANIQRVLTWYKYSTFCINLNNMNGLTSLINTYSGVQTDYNHFIVTINYNKFTVEELKTIRATLPPLFDLAVWTIDDKTNYLNYLPYCNVIFSNKLSPYIILNSN